MASRVPVLSFFIVTRDSTRREHDLVMIIR